MANCNSCSNIYSTNSCKCNSSGVNGCGCNNNSCGCNNNSCGCNNNSCGCNNHSCGCNGSGVFPDCLLPPRPSNGCHVCPPGTRPCGNFYPPCRPYPNYCPCGGTNNMGERAGTFAFLNTNGTTLTTGSIVPFRYVLGTGNLARNTNGGTVSLDSGTYIIAYSLGATAPTAGSTVTVTPEYGGALHPEYSRSFTVTAEGQSFELSDLLAITLPTDTSFSLNVTVNGCGTEPVTLTGVSASAIVYKVCDIIS